MAGPSYEINRPYRVASRLRYRLSSFIFIAILLLICIAAAWLWYDLSHLKTQTIKNRVGATSHVLIAGPQTFRNSFFQFSDTAKWVYVPGNSTANRLVYMLYQSGVPAHSLTVYVNQAPPSPVDIATTHVLPIQIKNGNSFTTGDISDTCGKLYKPTDPKRDRLIALSGTMMECVPDSPQFTVMVGQVGGDYNLSLKRSNGVVAKYIILYANLSVNPNPAPFERIMKTFQAL